MNDLLSIRTEELSARLTGNLPNRIKTTGSRGQKGRWCYIYSMYCMPHILLYTAIYIVCIACAS